MQPMQDDDIREGDVVKKYNTKEKEKLQVSKREDYTDWVDKL